MNPLVIKELLTSKTSLYLIIIMVLSLSHIYMYKKGFNEHKKQSDIENTIKLNDLLIEQNKKQSQAIKNALETANKDKDIEIKWKEKKVYIDKIVEKTIYKDCVMPIEDIKVFSEAWDSIK